MGAMLLRFEMDSMPRFIKFTFTSGKCVFFGKGAGDERKAHATCQGLWCMGQDSQEGARTCLQHLLQLNRCGGQRIAVEDQ